MANDLLNIDFTQPLVTTSVDGLMSAADKVKLNGLGSTSTGGVGTYAFLMFDDYAGTNVNPGNSIAGSSLKYAYGTGSNNSSPSGTWKCMGYSANGGIEIDSDSYRTATLYLRIS